MTSVYGIAKQISLEISKLSSLDNLEIEAKIRKIDESDFQFLREILTNQFEKIDSFSVDYYLKETRITEKDGIYTNTSKEKVFEEILPLKCLAA